MSSDTQTHTYTIKPPTAGVPTSRSYQYKHYVEYTHTSRYIHPRSARTSKHAYRTQLHRMLHRIICQLIYATHIHPDERKYHITTDSHERTYAQSRARTIARTDMHKHITQPSPEHQCVQTPLYEDQAAIGLRSYRWPMRIPSPPEPFPIRPCLASTKQHNKTIQITRESGIGKLCVSPKYKQSHVTLYKITVGIIRNNFMSET